MSTPEKIVLNVKENKKVGKQTHHLVLKGRLPTFKPGQFCLISYNEKKRAYSIASNPEEEFAICIKGVGETSNHFIGLQAGAAIEVQLPMGHFTIPNKGSIAMLASGTGIVPYRSMLRTLFKNHFLKKGEDTDRKITLIQGAKHQEALIYEEEFRGLAKAKKNFTYIPTLSQEERTGYEHGRVQQHLHKHLNNDQYLICGLTQMVEDVERLLSEQGIKKQNIHYEKYG